MHAVIKAVLEGAGQNPGTSCMFFALAGAYLLDDAHGLDVTAHVGSAFYGMGGDPPTILTFARFEGDVAVSDRDRFHAWIECNDWAIDLMAPSFPENAASQALPLKVPRRRFQRPLDALAPTLNDFEEPGSFGLIPNLPLRRELLEPLVEHNLTAHMVGQCLNWYRRTPGPIASELATNRLNHSAQVLRLPDVEIEGDW